jgi:[ribosomal protein S18]-alanine N-acetyltransferase
MAITGREALREVEIVPMRRRHLRGVLAIEEWVYPRAWSPSLFVSELDRADRHYVVALGPRPARWRARRVLGYAGVILQPDEAHISTVAVHPREHRRKLGTRLVAAVLRAAVDAGAPAATLEVRAGNLGAQRLYEGFGFVAIGVRSGYYAETGEDALIMWARELQSGAFAARLAEQERRVAEPGGASGAPDLAEPWVKERVGLPAAEGAVDPGPIGRAVDPGPIGRAGDPGRPADPDAAAEVRSDDRPA